MKKIAVVVSSILILVFGYTASSKLLEPGVFRAALAQVPLLTWGAAALSVLLPLAELGIVLLLLFSPTRRRGFLVSLLFLSVFTVFILYMLLFLPHLPCACGGVIGRLGWKGHVCLNLGLIGLTVIGIRKMQMTDEG